MNIQGHISESSNEEASDKEELYDENISQEDPFDEADSQLKLPPIDMNKVTQKRDFLKNFVPSEEKIIMQDHSERTTVREEKPKPRRNTKINISVVSNLIQWKKEEEEEKEEFTATSKL